MLFRDKMTQRDLESICHRAVNKCLKEEAKNQPITPDETFILLTHGLLAKNLRTSAIELIEEYKPAVAHNLTKHYARPQYGSDNLFIPYAHGSVMDIIWPDRENNKSPVTSDIWQRFWSKYELCLSRQSIVFDSGSGRYVCGRMIRDGRIAEMAIEIATMYESFNDWAV